MNLFQKNVQRLTLISPQEAEIIARLECRHVSFVTTGDNHLNLQQEVDGEVYDFYANDPVEEAQKWFSELDLENIDVLCVFGVGLGYYYEAAYAWLQKPSHYLVFLEHDLEVMHRLMETEMGTKLLHDPQVRLQYFDFQDGVKTWVSLAILFCHREFKMSALQYYTVAYPVMYEQISSGLTFSVTANQSIVSEYGSYGEHFFANFYRNLQLLPACYRGNALFGQFSGVPAIICGAGPSLDKNLALLETLGDRALIFAGGTAMNAVNSHGFLPAFGLAIDPYEGQMSRLIMNKAYETPFLYRNRMYHEALRFIQGDKLYITGAGGYDIADWFEKQLGIEGEKICEGHNVVNFSLSIAHAMGCNPIILVGLDLSYEGLHSYQSGVVSHPTNVQKRDFHTKGFHEELLVKSDLYGNPVYTLWKWISESIYYSHFAADHPEVAVINATEGGIGMEGILNATLKDVSEYYLQRQFDIPLRIHGEIQNALMPSTVTEDKIRELVHEFLGSLLCCQSHCQTIIEESLLIADRLEKGEETSDTLMTDRSSASLKALEAEIAYTHLLYHFNEYYMQKMAWDLLKLTHDTTMDANMILAKKARMQAERYKFVRDTAIMNASFIRIFVPKKQVSSPDDQITDAASSIQYSPEERYFFEDNVLTIIDPELNLDYQETVIGRVNPDPLYYPDGSIKMEQFYLEHDLHGPITFYSAQGHVLAKSWYIKGVKQGKSWMYYANQKLYSLQRFIDGKPHGIQEYYYKNGRRKTHLNYVQGELDGEVTLYYPNGNKKRQLHYKQGLHHGIEESWYETGKNESRVEYEDDRPIKKAQKWFPNGQLALEITYDAAHQPSSISYWNENGSPKVFETEDYFDVVTKQTGVLTQSLDHVYDVLSSIVPQERLKEEPQESFQDDLLKLKQEMEHLHELNTNLLFESGLDKDNLKEAIWKTPVSQKIIQQQIEEVSKKFSDEIGHMQDILKQAMDDIEKK